MDPALAGLPEIHRRLWVEPAARTEALQRIVNAGEPGEVRAALETVDHAVRTGMAAFGFPSQPPRSVRLNPFGHRGRVSSVGDLEFGTPWITQDVNVWRNPDTTFRAWVQESAHLRAPFAPGWEQEYLQLPGYEEGLAEGVALLLTRAKAGMEPAGNPLYGRFVRAYELLALRAGVPVENLYRRLWLASPGEVRDHLAAAVRDERQAAGGRRLTSQQARALLPAADTLFARGPSTLKLDDAAILTIWTRAFP